MLKKLTREVNKCPCIEHSNNEGMVEPTFKAHCRILRGSSHKTFVHPAVSVSTRRNQYVHRVGASLRGEGGGHTAMPPSSDKMPNRL